MEWFENEDFWADLYPFLFPRERMEKAAQEVEKVLSLVERPVRSVLDLCCGPGRHSIALAQLGLRVTAVDKSSFNLEKARKRASLESVDVEWIQDDMRDFARDQEFDLVLSMFTSFGYFENEQDDLKVLQNIRGSLTPGGVLVLDLAGKEWLAENFQETAMDILPDGSKLVQHRRIVNDWSRIRNEWILVKDKRAKSYSFEHTVYSGRELKDRLWQAEFHRADLYGNLDGSEYGPGCERLIAVAVK